MKANCMKCNNNVCFTIQSFEVTMLALLMSLHHLAMTKCQPYVSDPTSNLPCYRQISQHFSPTITT